MTTFTRAPRPGAMALACAFSTVTAWLVVGDVPTLAAITPGHAMSILVVAGAINFGHAAFPAFRHGRPVLGAAMAVLAVACTLYVCLAAGIRYAATAAERAASIENANRQRRQADIDAKAARALHAEAQREERAECGRVGPQCARRAQRTAAAWSHVLISDATRSRLGAIEEADAGIATAARALATVPSMPPADRIAATLALGLPWLLVIVTECAAIALWLAALPHRAVSHVAVQPKLAPLHGTAPAADAAAATVPATALIAATVPAQSRALPAALTKGAAQLLDILASADRPIGIAEAAAHMQVCRAEASKRYREAGAAVVARRDGRRLLLSLA